MPPLWHLDDRTRFIVLRGVLRFGLAIGAVAAWLGAAPSGQVGGEGVAHLLGVLVAPTLAFLEWGIGGGWLIGAVLWSLSPHERAGAVRGSETRRPDDR